MSLLAFVRIRAFLAVWALISGMGCHDTRDRPAQPRLPPAASSDAGATAPPSPSGEAIGVLRRFAAVLPVRPRALAVLPADALHQAFLDLAGALLHPLALSRPEEVGPRLKTRIGLDPSSLGPSCVFAWLEGDGPVLLCEAAGEVVLERPPDAVGWKAWAFRGVATKDLVAAAAPRARGLGDFGPSWVAVGSEAAVRRVAMVHGGEWPSLQHGLGRVEAEVLRAGRGAEKDLVSLWFFDPHAAPWCLPGVCQATAAFFSRTGLRVVAEARPGMGPALKASVEVLWRRDVVERFAGRVLADAVAKPADLLVRQATVELREPLVTLRSGPGDPVFLAAALYPDLVLGLLGPSR